MLLTSMHTEHTIDAYNSRTQSLNSIQEVDHVSSAENSRIRRRCCFPACAFVPAFAQVTTATILGTVRDLSGATIPGASVTITQENTGYTRSVVSAEDGTYVAPLLPVGAYSVTVERPGFARYTQPGITLELNQNARVDANLTVGGVQETVTVNSAAPLVDTRGTSLGEVVEQRTIMELPLNGRNPIQLAAVTAGVSTISAPTILTWTGRNGATLTVHGSRTGENLYLLDGGYFTGTFYRTGMNYPSPDALQEFRLITNSYTAEYGQAVGSMFNAVTRSGTNELHGSAFEFLRNDALNARNFFAPSVPLLRQNQFGATLGGPVKRDRVFLFGSYQGTRVHQQTLLSGFPTTTQEINGFFTEPAGRVLRNPATGQPYPLSTPATNTYFVDPATFNPIAVRVNATWVPAAPSAGQYVSLAPNPQINDQYLIKGDANVSSKNRATVSYFCDRTRFTNPAYGGSTFLNYSATDSRVDVWSGSVADTHTFTPTLINRSPPPLHARLQLLGIDKQTHCHRPGHTELST
jgi:hypothetical protein